MDIGRQLGDWRAAITYARGLAGIDGDRVALWGTSFSGGHVAALAAADQQIAAVISQVPYSGLGGRGGLPRPVFLGRMIAAAVRDELHGRLGMRPAFLPLVAEPGSGVFAPFVERGATAALLDLFPSGSGWPNRFTPRVMLRLPRYRPFDTTDRISLSVAGAGLRRRRGHPGRSGRRAGQPRSEDGASTLPGGAFCGVPRGVVRAGGRRTDRVLMPPPGPDSTVIGARGQVASRCSNPNRSPSSAQGLL